MAACTSSTRLLLLLFVSSFLVSSSTHTPSCRCSKVPPPPPPECHLDPISFINLEQYRAYLIIQLFKLTITSDPFNITNTWVGPRPCVDYRGFYCEAPPDSPDTPTVASIDFNGFHLAAPTLVGFIDQFPGLAIFHANSNNFSGTIPDLTGLRYLYELDFSNNNLSGPFPSTLLPLANLTFLDIRFNHFAGAVLPDIFFLGLDVLFLNNNFFNESLPATLGSTTAAYLTLANNGFTGPIPSSICNASKTLVEVLFLNNKLSGCLPFEIGLLSNATVFDAGLNQITGPIPWSFGCLLNVEQLNLAENLLYGEVPDVVCRLAVYGNLANLSLSGNYFTSLGRTCRELIRNNSDVIDVRKNCIRGLPNQRPAAECRRFKCLPNKSCPELHYIPCSLPRCRRLTAATPPSHVTYNMLHPPPRHN